MTRTAEVREAYQQYLDGKRPLDEVLDLADRARARLPSRPPGPNGPWRPLSARRDPERAREFDGLDEDVSPLLRGSLIEWLGGLVGFKDPVDPSPWAARLRWKEDLRSRIGAALRLPTPIAGDVDDLPTAILLDTIDFVLSRTDTWQAHHLIELEERLAEGGSAWRATADGLERRADETIQSVADSVFVTNDRPADYLRSAWHKAWGRNPDASGAHQEAVNATEAAYAHIVSPMNDRATLGTIIRDIRAKPPKFRVRLQATTGEEDVGRVAAMMELLLKSQRRHGTDDRSGETIEEARDAVALATTLVHLAQQGGFTASGR